MNEEVTAEAEDAVVAEEVEVVETVEVDAKTEETTEADDGEAKAEAKDPEPSDPSPEKKSDGVQKRIDELTKLRRDQERETDYWKQMAQNKENAPPTVTKELKTLADFEYDEGKYSEYVVGQARADATLETDRKFDLEKQARIQADFSAQEADFAKNVDDYHITTRNQDLKLTGEMVAAAQSSEAGAEVLYYLGKNPEVADRLARMSPLQMARDMGKIEAVKLVKKKAPSESKAPKPVPKLKPTDSKVEVSPANMTDTQFRKWRQKAIANR